MNVRTPVLLKNNKCIVVSVLWRKATNLNITKTLKASLSFLKPRSSEHPAKFANRSGKQVQKATRSVLAEDVNPGRQ